MFALIAVLMPIGAHGQASLEIQGRDLAIGMDRQTVLDKLKGYRLHCFGESKQVTVCNSLLVQDAQPPYDAHANVAFANGKVKSLRKYWSRGFQGSDPGKFVQTLYSLLAHHRNQGVDFEVSLSERRDPGLLQQTIFLSFGRKTISISYVEGARGVNGERIPPFVNLDEHIE